MKKKQKSKQKKDQKNKKEETFYRKCRKETHVVCVSCQSFATYNQRHKFLFTEVLF